MRYRDKARSSRDAERPIRIRPIIGPPQSSLARYTGHMFAASDVGAKRASYMRHLSDISERDDDDDDDARYLQSPQDVRPSYLRPRESAAVYYNCGPFTDPRCPARPNSGLAHLYMNVDELRMQKSNAERQHGGRGEMETSFQEIGFDQQRTKGRPVSQFPEDDMSASAVSRSGLSRRPDTRSIYPTDANFRQKLTMNE